jgi:hypothetical protein
MKKHLKPNIALFLFSFFAFSHYCHAKTLMSVEQMKAETGKGFSVASNSTGGFDIALEGYTKSGIPISAYGTADILQKTQESNHQASLAFSDAAQQGMQAFSSVNAVNSPVQVVTNLVVNINSTTETINQVNHVLQQGLPQELLQ